MLLPSRSKALLHLGRIILLLQVFARPVHAEPPVDVDLRREEDIEESVSKPLFRNRYGFRVEEIEVPDGPAKKAVLFINHTRCHLQVTGTLEHEYTTYTDARIVNGSNGAYRIPGSSSTQSNLTYPVNLRIGPSSSTSDSVTVLYVNDMKAMLPTMPNIARLKVKILDDEKTIIANYKLGDGSQTTLAEAFQAEKAKADAGDPASAFRIGMIFKYGDFVYTDVTLYEKYINLSSAREHVPGQAEQALILLNSDKSTPVRTRNGLALAQRAGDDGDADALLLLGCCYDYFTIPGIAKDLDKAVSYYRKSADLGNRVAMSDLGYLFGHDFPEGSKSHRDPREARAWYKKAADLGDPVAKLHLENAAPAPAADK